MLGEYRKLDPGPVEEFIFFDHPSRRTRITAAMRIPGRAHKARLQFSVGIVCLSWPKFIRRIYVLSIGPRMRRGPSAAMSRL